jgi:hypothetical protein
MRGAVFPVGRAGTLTSVSWAPGADEPPKSSTEMPRCNLVK